MHSWVVGMLQGTLKTWNDKLAEIWTLLTESPQTFKGGTVWNVIVELNGAMQAIGYALLVLFFAISIFKSSVSFRDFRRPEILLRHFICFGLAKAAITHGTDLMLKIFSICNGVVAAAASRIGGAGGTPAALPEEMIKAIDSAGLLASIPLWAIAVLGWGIIAALSIVILLTVYGRFFRLYMYTALSPVALASLAGEATARYCKAFLRSYVGVCLEGAVIAIACLVYSALASGTPTIDPDASAVWQMWGYLGEVIFNMLILVGLVKAADRIAKEMFGL